MIGSAYCKFAKQHQLNNFQSHNCSVIVITLLKLKYPLKFIKNIVLSEALFSIYIFFLEGITNDK